RGALHGVDGRRRRPPSGVPRAAGRQAGAGRAARRRGGCRLNRVGSVWLDLDRDAPEAGLAGHARDVVPFGLRGTGDVSRALRVVEDELDLLALWECLEGELRLRPAER